MYRYKSAKQEYGRREEVEESATKTRRKREDRLDSTLQRGAYGHGMDKVGYVAETVPSSQEI